MTTFLGHLWTAVASVWLVITAGSVIFLAACWFCARMDDLNRRATARTHPSHPERQARTYVDTDDMNRWTRFDDEAVARVLRGES